MATSRTRSKTSIVDGGIVRQSNGTILGTFSYTEEYHVTLDEYLKKTRADGSLPPGIFNSDKRLALPGVLTKTSGTFRFERLADGTPSMIPGMAPMLLQGSSERNAQNAAYAQELLAMTNPFRSDFSVPVFIKELLELPALIRIKAATLSTYVGGNYLNYKFGWVQLDKDVTALSGILKAIEFRMKDFDILLKRGNLRKRVKQLNVEHLSSTTTDVVIHSTYGVTVRATRNSRSALKTWGSVRWGMHEEFADDLKKLSTLNLALTKVLDLQKPDSETLWQMTPFTWLVDYLEGISSFLGSWKGKAEIYPYDICIMRELRSEDRYQVTSIPSTTQHSGSSRHVRVIKSRDLATRGNFPATPIELLTDSQWRNVLALFLSLGGKKR